MELLTSSDVVALRYRIIGHLGSGGMAQVYKAMHLGLRKPVALKVLGPESATTSFGARFEREARAIARLEHPGCVRVLDYGRWVDRSRYLAMDLLEGPTLRELLQQEEALCEQRAIGVMANVLKALAHAHRRGVLHRDVKPANIMFATRDNASRPVLIDFGLAQLQGETALTAAGVCCGSPSYLSPERLLGRPYDARADVYSVGVMLYELLSGQRPFGDGAAHEIARRQILQPPLPLAALGVAVSPALAALIDRALAKDPRVRFADAESMLAALEEIPALEQRAFARRIEQQAEEEPTSMMPLVGPYKPPLHRRMWAWLRYGRWRWQGQPPIGTPYPGMPNHRLPAPPVPSSFPGGAA